MKNLYATLSALPLIALAGCASTGSQAGMSEDDGMQAASAEASATAELFPKSMSTVNGTARFSQDDSGEVTLQVEVSGLEPGEHAIHLHEVGDCSAPDASSAGPHWDPTSDPHGKWGHGGHHLGDIGNLEAGEDGTATYELTTDHWAIGSGDGHDVVGKAVVVHAKADDFESQPSGDAGGRVACGVVRLDQ